MRGEAHRPNTTLSLPRPPAPLMELLGAVTRLLPLHLCHSPPTAVVYLGGFYFYSFLKH